MKRMTKQLLWLTVLVLALSMYTGAARAASDRYYRMSLSGVTAAPGDSSLPQWIDVLNCSHSSVLPDDGTRFPWVEIQFSHEFDKTTPILQQRVMSQEPIENAKIEYYRIINGQPVLIFWYEAQDIVVKRAEIKPVERSDGDFMIVEHVEMVAKKFKMYSNTPKPPQTGDGSRVFLWAALCVLAAVGICFARKRGKA